MQRQFVTISGSSDVVAQRRADLQTSSPRHHNFLLLDGTCPSCCTHCYKVFVVKADSYREACLRLLSSKEAMDYIVQSLEHGIKTLGQDLPWYLQHPECFVPDVSRTLLQGGEGDNLLYMGDDAQALEAMNERWGQVPDDLAIEIPALPERAHLTTGQRMFYGLPMYDDPHLDHCDGGCVLIH